MKCPHCGKEIHKLIIKDRVFIGGKEINCDEVVKIDENMAFFNFILNYITMDGWEEIKKDGIENHICCHECGKYPLEDKQLRYDTELVEVAFEKRIMKNENNY